MNQIIVTEKEFAMTLDFKTTYLKAIRVRYFHSTKRQKSKILEELCKVIGQAAAKTKTPVLMHRGFDMHFSFSF